MSCTSRFRIAAFTNLFPTAYDPGQGAFIEQQLKGLTQAGVEVKIVHLDRRAHGVSVYRQVDDRMEELERSFSPDVIHVMYGGVLAERVTSARPRQPIVISFCGSDLLGDRGNGWRRQLAGQYGVRASQKAAGRANGIIVKSPGLRDALDPAIDKSKVWVLPNGIDLDRFRPMEQAVCRETLGWPRDRFSVLFANGSSSGVKRIELAAAAVEQLNRAGIPADLREMSKVPPDQVPVWLNAADVVILTSHHEGSPNIIKEALACNRPIVTVDVGDVRQRLAGVNGCYIADAEPERLAEALRRVYAGPRQIEGRCRVREFGLPMVSERLISIYETILERQEMTVPASERPSTKQVEISSSAPRRLCSAPFRRWLILSQYYAPEPGAPQIRLRALTKELLRRGCEVEVVTALPNYPHGRIFPGYRGKPVMTEMIDGIPVHRVPLYPAAGRKSLQRILCYLSFSLTAAIRSPFVKRPDVIFVEAQPITLALAGYLSSILRKVPFIYNTPDLQVEIADDKRWVSLNTIVKYAARLESFLMRRAHCVSTVTEQFIAHFASCRGIDRSRITFLPNGADVETLRPLPFDHEYARELGVEGKKVFTYAGTHAPYQGLEIIPEAVEHLRDRQDIVVLMVGQGPLRETLQRQASERGITNLFFRDSPFQDMARLMSITQASIATIAPMSAAAKMRLSKVVPPLACGVPVLYVGEGEWQNILEERGCGRIVATRSAEEFARNIRELADNPELCREMGRKGREFVEAELSWSVIVERWLNELSRLNSGQAPSVLATEPSV
ncbi:MAG TPA: glycosyltransferase [Bryobacteraceae bacterium]|nr:glycosyltransferase [Bryobacteraceae bacterium]